MKQADVVKLKDDKLAEALATSRAELFNLRFRLATGQLDDTTKIPAVKKDIARIQTEIRSRELKAQAEEASAAGVGS
ncbi:MAG: 50S ribosomal protein L29 [Coriobacteriia bacterium]|nr:50S ribosomal protein L29 [Coriobacteriia bacterium]MCL2870402.1 50S ribosomal protein L29 [Coriobacteriia bacterium]